MTKKTAILLIKALLTLTFLAGCATQDKYDFQKEWITKKEVKEAITKAQAETARKSEETLIKKISPKPRARVEMSSIEVISADWNGVLFKKVGDIKLRFSLKETNGISVSFDQYYARVICTYSGLLGTKEATRTGKFFFRNPLKLEPLELKDVSISLSTWVSKTANSMDRILKIEEYRVYVTLKGKDDYQNTIITDSESAPI